MATYKEMYFHLFTMTEYAMDALLAEEYDLAYETLYAAQLDCEEMYLENDDPLITQIITFPLNTPDDD